MVGKVEYFRGIARPVNADVGANKRITILAPANTNTVICTYIIAAYWAISYFGGLSIGFLGKSYTDLATMIICFITGLLAVAWAIYDSSSKERRISFQMKLFIFIIPILGLPVYVATTRNQARLKSLTKLVGAIFFGLLAAMIGAYLGFALAIK